MLAVMLASIAATNKEGDSTRKVGGVNQFSASALLANESERGSSK